MKLASLLPWTAFIHLPTKADVAYHLGLSNLTWYGVTSHVAPWIALFAFVTCAVTAAASMILAKLPVQTPQTESIKITTKLIAYASGIAAIVSFGIYFSALQQQALAYSKLNSQVVSMEYARGCLDRKNTNEHDLFVCIPAQDAEAAAAVTKAKSEQEQEAAKAQAALAETIKQIDVDQDAEGDAETAEKPADDGPLPQDLLDSWSRKRARVK